LKDHLLDTKEAAGFLNVSEMTIRRWTNSGALNCYRVGGKRERRFQMKDLAEFLQGFQNPNKQMRLGYRALKVPDGSHLTHFYSSSEEALEVSVPYVLEGLNGSEVVLAVMSPERSRGLMNALERQGRPVAEELRKGRLNLNAGMDSPEEMIRYLVGFVGRVSKFRLLEDMSWSLGRDWDFAALGDLEKAAALMPQSESRLVLCQYSLTDFSGVHIMMASEAHEYILYNGKLEKSPYYDHRKAREKNGRK